MKLRIVFSLVFLFLALRLDAAMVRVISIADAQTLVVERNGVAETIKLAGITIVDDRGARELLQWTLVSSWVLLEQQAGGAYFVYRSPDALFVNRELVLRGFARSTLAAIEPQQHVVVTYLGTLRIGAAKETAAPKNRAARGSGSGTTPSSPAKPSRRRRPPKP